MRRDRDRLVDILEALKSIEQTVNEAPEAGFLSNEDMYHATAYRLTVVGEAAARMSAEFKQNHPEIRWRGIIGLRNVLVHQYFGVDRTLVWRLAADRVPPFRAQIEQIIDTEFPE
jgi:uncharacterized protein with HEPN domain